MTNVHKAYDDWNHLYEQEWLVASRTYSQKWGWEYSQQPSNPYPSKASLERMYGKYKKTGPQTYSDMYKRVYTTVTYTDDIWTI